MTLAERRSMKFHVAFSGVLVAALLAIIFVKHDVPGLFVAGFIALYVGGNTLLHYLRHDFRKETVYEYLLVALAVGVIVYGAFRH